MAIPSIKTVVIVDKVRPLQHEIKPLLGGEIMRRLPVIGVMRLQDTLLAGSLRVVAEQDMGTANNWLVPNTNPDFGTRTHPDSDTVRTTADHKLELTPGNFLALSVLYAPSGETQLEVVPGSDYDAAGAGGSIQAVVTWSNGADTETTTHEIGLQRSELEFGKDADGTDGELYTSLRTARVLVAPAIDRTKRADWEKYAHRTTVVVSLRNIGGCRIVHAVLFEWPMQQYARDHDETEMAAHIYEDEPSLTHPLQRVTETAIGGIQDNRFGTFQTLDVADFQSSKGGLGPCLIRWSAYDEEVGAVTDTEPDPKTQTSGTPTSIFNAGQTSYDADQPGFSFSAGGYARTFNEAEDGLVLRGKDGVIPVRVRVFARQIGGGTGTVRLQTADFSLVDIPVTSASYSVLEEIAYLRCGIGPEDIAVAQIFLSQTGGTQVELKYLVANYGDQALPT